MRGDVVLCEGAVSHLTDCCGSTPNVDCTYSYAWGGLWEGDHHQWPELDEEESQSILDASCQSLRAHGSCDSYAGGGS